MNNIRHKCKYALCNDCFEREKGHRPIQGQHISLAHDKFIFNHVNLNLFTESYNFEAVFVKLKIARDNIFPLIFEDFTRKFSHAKI